jgi:hypothetical protein
MQLYQNDSDQREITINNFFESTKDVYEKISEFVKDIKKGIYKVDFDMEKKLQTLEKEQQKNDDSTYPIAWPIYPIEKIQTYFGDDTFQKQYGIPHI